MYRLRHAIIGKSGGNFRYQKMHKQTFLSNLSRQMYKRGISSIFSPHCQLTTNITRAHEEAEITITPWFTRTQPGVDGAIITEPGKAIAIFNADCPVIILFDKTRGHLAMLHAGLRCLLPEDQDKPNIIETALKDPLLDPKMLSVFIGYGASSCCYGANHIEELKEQRFRRFINKATKGPRTGQRSLDLLGLAQQEVTDSRTIYNRITINRVCTACAGRESGNNGYFYSNIYDGSSTGRNLVLAWLEKK